MFLKGLIGIVDLTVRPVFPCPLAAVFRWQGHSLAQQRPINGSSALSRHLPGNLFPIRIAEGADLTRKGCFFAVLAAAVAISGAAIVPAATQDKPVAKPAAKPVSAD